MIVTAYGSDLRRDVRKLIQRFSADARRTRHRCRGAAARRGAVRVQHGLRHHALRRRIEAPVGMLGEKTIDLFVVLFGLERAGAVDEQPARLYDASRVAKDRALQRRHHGDVGDLQPPARVGMPPKRSRSRARRVDEHQIDRSNGREARASAT